jgi:hypothetical protein
MCKAEVEGLGHMNVRDCGLGMEELGDVWEVQRVGMEVWWDAR